VQPAGPPELPPAESQGLQTAAAGFPIGATVPGGGTPASNGDAIDTLLAWQALCWSILAGDPAAPVHAIAELLATGGQATGSSGEPVLVLHPLRDQAFLSAAPSVAEPGWPIPFTGFVDPRETLGAILFVVLGVAALCFALSAAPGRAYAGVRVAQENALILRGTLALAGLVLILAAGIGQLTA
jgi:hypothetical protein